MKGQQGGRFLDNIPVTQSNICVQQIPDEEKIRRWLASSDEGAQYPEYDQVYNPVNEVFEEHSIGNQVIRAGDDDVNDEFHCRKNLEAERSTCRADKNRRRDGSKKHEHAAGIKAKHLHRQPRSRVGDAVPQQSRTRTHSDDGESIITINLCKSRVSGTAEGGGLQLKCVKRELKQVRSNLAI